MIGRTDAGAGLLRRSGRTSPAARPNTPSSAAPHDGRSTVDKTLHLVEAMKAKLRTPRGKKMLRARLTSIEPLFGQAKENRHHRRFARRGLTAAQAEWQLIAAASNLRKLQQALATS